MAMIKKRMGLGKGLGALLNNEQPRENDIIDDIQNEISVDAIETNPFQPRTSFDSVALDELKTSIQTQGIIQPITVRKIGDNKYQLISGERRWQASKLAGLKKIPAFVKEVTDNQMIEMGLIENIQREDLNPIEIALAYKRLISECNLKQEELGNRVGKDRSTVNNYLRLLNLPELIQNGIKEKTITLGHARALLGISDAEKMKIAFKFTVDNQLSVRKVEELVKKSNTENESIKKEKTQKPEVISHQDVEVKLEKYFSNNVKVISDKNTKGEIKIAFSSKSEFENIIKKLKK